MHKIVFSLVLLPFSLQGMDRHEEGVGKNPIVVSARNMKLADNYDECTSRLAFCAKQCLDKSKHSLFQEQFVSLWGYHKERRDKAIALVTGKQNPSLQDRIAIYAGCGAKRSKIFQDSNSTALALHAFLKKNNLDAAKTLLLTCKDVFNWDWFADNDIPHGKHNRFRLFGSMGLEASIGAYGDMNIIETVMSEFGRKAFNICRALCRYNRIDLLKDFICRYHDDLFDKRYQIYDLLITTLLKTENQEAIEAGRVYCNMLKIVIHAFGESIKAGDSDLGMFLLSRAVSRDHLPLLELLIKKRVNVNQPLNDKKETALMRMLHGTSYVPTHDLTCEMVNALLTAEEVDVNATDAFGFSVLHHLVLSGYHSNDENIAQALINKGAKRELQDSWGKTAYDHVNTRYVSEALLEILKPQ